MAPVLTSGAQAGVLAGVADELEVLEEPESALELDEPLAPDESDPEAEPLDELESLELDSEELDEAELALAPDDERLSVL